MRPEQPDNAAGAADVEVGRIVAPWGIQGDMRIDPLTDNPVRFQPGGLMRLRDRPARVIRSRKAGRYLIAKLEGVDDRNAAEALRGELLTITPDEAPPLDREGTYYHFQIVGIDVYDESGVCLGEVTDILTTGGNDVYSVRDCQGGEVLLPAIPDVVLDVDTERGRMTVHLLDGLSGAPQAQRGK